jgi:hypothetical protein
LTVPGNLANKTLKVTTSGKGDPTSAEERKNAYILAVLQGQHDLLDENPWIKNIWLASDKLLWPDDFFPGIPSSDPLPAESFSHPLNDSQLDAVNHMLSRAEDNCITVIQGSGVLAMCDLGSLCLLTGPPGTGKTSVIAAYVEAAVRLGQKGIWLIAQSNVAVKNIAEKLCSSLSLPFILLVSTDFYREWSVLCFLFEVDLGICLSIGMNICTTNFQAMSFAQISSRTKE